MTYAEAIKTIESNRPTSGFTMLCEALDLAIEALEKQIPTCDWGPYKEFVCSKCGLENDIFYGNYCPVCGQRITIEPVPLNTGLGV